MNMSPWRAIALCAPLVTLVWTLGPSVAAAADPPYPSRTVKILTPTGPGGPSDTMIRGVAELLGREMGQPFVVENRPGGEGIIAGEACSTAPPDGYTLCLAEAFNTILLPLTKSGLSYDPARWSAVALFGFLPTGMWLAQSVAAEDAKSFLALARKRPGELTIGSWGRASSPYLHAEFLRKSSGTDLTVVGYRSAVAAWQATVAGETSAALFGLQGGLPMAEAGKVRLLAINTESRLPDFPNVPTFSEVGLQSGTMLWFALFAPPGTPAAIVSKVNEAIAKLVFNDAATKERLLTSKGFLAVPPAGTNPATVTSFIRSQRQTYEKWVSIAGVTPE